MAKEQTPLSADIAKEFLRILNEIRPQANETPPPQLEGKALAAANLYVDISTELEVGPPFFAPPPPPPPPPVRVG